MPEIGRPISPQELQYRQVEIGPRKLSNRVKSESELKEEIINKATGYKPKNNLFKEGPHNQMGKDEFLKLLSFQLQNQDPMNPMDQGKMTGELAQFSQLEQLTALNKKFDNNNKNQAIEDKFYAASFVGKKVVTQGTTLNLKESGDPADVLFNLEGDASKVMIRILDEKNNITSEIWKDGLSRGSHQVSWDGVALDGSPAVKGSYRIQVKAWDQLGEDVPSRTEATGLVQSVMFEDGEPILSVDGKKVFLRDVVSFHTAEAKTHVGATNTDLLQRNNSMLKSNQQLPLKQAVNAYTETKGIYD